MLVTQRTRDTEGRINLQITNLQSVLIKEMAKLIYSQILTSPKKLIITMQINIFFICRDIVEPILGYSCLV